MKKIKNPILEWQRLEKQIENKDNLSTTEYIDVLEKSIEVLLYLRKQDLSVRDFMMDKSMELIKRLAVAYADMFAYVPSLSLIVITYESPNSPSTNSMSAILIFR